MPATINSASLLGMKAIKVTVEVDSSPGNPREQIVGLPDAVIKESICRIKSAIKNSGYKFPHKVYTINLAPAELPKEGPFFDVPIALGILERNKEVFVGQENLYVGELSLNGDIRPIRGIISICQMAAKEKFGRIFIPLENLPEASLVEDIEIVPVENLKQIIRIVEGLEEIPPKKQFNRVKTTYSLDYSEVKGQLAAKRALEIAASGKHNILLVGSPGSGKTMLLKRLPTILPELCLEEAIETINLRSIANRALKKDILSFYRPFRRPHHSISYAGLAGGGSNPKPGEISLAHNGILFLDEFPEFTRQALEVLRQPIEEKMITISRANISVDYPADFMLVAAMNPCPCGYYRDTKVECTCQQSQITKYWKKISGPILDRIDIVIEIPRLEKKDVVSSDEHNNVFTSTKLRERVKNAIELQYRRFEKQAYNADMSPKEMQSYCEISSQIKDFLGNAVDKGWLTGRSYDKVLKVARTIADMEEASSISLPHVSEALQYRKIAA